MPVQTLAQVARHESAHVLVGHCLGVRFLRASIVRVPGVYRGAVWYGPCPPRAELSMVCAGPLSVQPWGYSGAPAALEGEDLDVARRCLRLLPAGAMAECQDVALRLLRRHERALGWLSVRLGALKEMSGPEIHEYLSAYVGVPA